MRIFDEEDNEVTEDPCDLDLGYLKQDYRLIQKHERTEEQPEEGHTRVTVTFTDGDEAVFDNGRPLKYFDQDTLEFMCVDEYEGKTVLSVDDKYVIDKEYVPGEEEWFENEEIQRYVKYTQEELNQIAENKRLSEELAKQAAEKAARYQLLLDNDDDTTLVLADSLGTVSDTETQVSDLTLAMADLIGGE